MIIDTTALVSAISDMAGVIAECAHEIGTSFTCTEADSVAAVLAIAGHTQDAALFLSHHAAGDVDDTDWHAHLHDETEALRYAERLAERR